MSHKTVPFNIPAPWWCALPPLLQAAALLALSLPNSMAWGVYGSFLAISAVSSWRLFSDGRPYSLNKLWWVFALVFLSIVPSLMLAVQATPWQLEGIPAVHMLQANGLILLCFGVFEGVRLWASRNFIPQAEHAPPSVSPVVIRQFAHLAPAMMLTCGAVLLIIYGIKGLFMGGHTDGAFWHQSGTFRLVIETAIRATMLWCCLSAIVLYRQHKLERPSLLLVLIPGILFNSPLTIPDYLILTIYLGWALAAGFELLRRRHALSFVLIAAFLLAAPFRSGTNSIVIHDAWGSLCRTIQYVSSHGYTAGRQLIGAVLFFVPQSVWPVKPTGSGALLGASPGSDSGETFCTFIAEGFIDFGIPGSLVFCAMLALVIARYDGWYWRRGGRVRFTLPRLF